MRMTVRGLSHRHPGHQAATLRGIDLSVEAGEAVAIMGPSGSGKTTLLALMGGLLPIQTGEVLLEDHGTPTCPDYQVAWILQTANVLVDRTVIDNACLGAFAAGLDRAEATGEARRWLEAVELGTRCQDPVRMLSGGEVQRVVIARALASRRPILLADEPTGQLDARTTDTVLSVLLDRSHGRSVIVVTHDPDVARRCDRALQLRDGVLVGNALNTLSQR